MSLVSLVLLAAGGWIFLASLLQYEGAHAWAYSTCASLYGLCNHPYPILYGTIASAAFVFIIGTLRQS